MNTYLFENNVKKIIKNLFFELFYKQDIVYYE